MIKANEWILCKKKESCTYKSNINTAYEIFYIYLLFKNKLL